jgi:uncharacterized RDD family membrane protein YckC
MDTEWHTIQGVTGVDVSLPIAGPGSRSYAFIIDWHIRTVLALAWLMAAAWIEGGGLKLAAIVEKRSMTAMYLVFLVPVIVYFFYHPVLELFMRGQSPGKRIAGVRVVTVEGGTPGVGAVLIRNIFRLIDCLPTLYFVGLMTTLFSAQRVRVGDMAAGTMLVIDERISSKYLERAGAGSAETKLNFATLDLIEQILERWPSLGVEQRDAIARALLKKTLGSAGSEGVDAMNDASLRDHLVSLSNGVAAK